MKNLDASIKYTKDMMEHQMRTMESGFHNEPIEELGGYIQGSEHCTSVSLEFNRLSTWYFWCFTYEFTEHSQVDYELLSKSTYYGVYANQWDYKIGLLSENYDYSVLFEDSSYHLGQLLFLGFDEDAKAYMNLLLTMLHGKQGKSFASYPAYPWLILQLFMKWQGMVIPQICLDRSNELIPLYKKILDEWDSDDDQLIDSLIEEASSYHIYASNEYERHKKPDDDGIFNPYINEHELMEFSSADHFLFPVEILTWLTIRRRMGLYSGENLPPLLQLKINQPPVNKLDIPKKDDIVIQCEEKLQNDNRQINLKID